MILDSYIRYAERLGYKVFRGDKGPFNLNIVGYRDRRKYNDSFSDSLHVFWEESKGVWQKREYTITTLPGVPYLLKPLYKKGTAILMPGQYDGCYQIGLHQGKYEALVQRGPVAVCRDNNLDSTPDEKSGFIECGLFGINIHKAGILNKYVGLNSAGCQVFKYLSQYEEFMELCNRSASIFGNKFTYTLVEL